MPLEYDAELQRHDPLLRRACAVRTADHVLDIGCGAGQTTVEAAVAATAGSALGVDISGPAIERARDLASGRGLRNITFDCADAQVCRLPPEHFDLAMSRFGTMFFGDPGVAFGNIRRALRPSGRLVMMVWQAHERNEWSLAIAAALQQAGQPGAVMAPESGAAFSLADPPGVTSLLESAGFAGVDFADVREPVYYGGDVAAALDWVGSFACTRAGLRRLGSVAAPAAMARLRDMLTAHLSADGVWLGSRAWIISARCR